MDTSTVVAVVVASISAVASAIVTVIQARKKIDVENKGIIVSILEEQLGGRDEQLTRLEEKVDILSDDVIQMQVQLTAHIRDPYNREDIERHYIVSENVWRTVDRELLYIREQYCASRATVYSLGNGSKFSSGESEQVYSIKCENTRVNEKLKRKQLEQRVSISGEIYDMIELSGKGLIHIKDLGDDYHSLKAYIASAKTAALISRVIKYGSVPCAILLLEFIDTGDKCDTGGAVARVEELAARMQATIVDEVDEVVSGVGGKHNGD